MTEWIAAVAGLLAGAVAALLWARARMASEQALWKARGEELEAVRARTEEEAARRERDYRERMAEAEARCRGVQERADGLNRENRALAADLQAARKELELMRGQASREAAERDRRFQEQLRLVQEQLQNATREMLGRRSQELSQKNNEQMADVEPLELPWLPEKFQTIGGRVNRSERPNPDFKKPSNLRKEVNVWAMFVQGDKTFELKQETKDGTFYMRMPPVYGECMLFLSAAALNKDVDYIVKRRQKGFTDEEAWPDYYVKLDLFHPHFAHPYSYYQDMPPQDLTPFAENEDSLVHNMLADRLLPTITVHTARNGLRRYDPTKPALVVDANEAYNLAADYGLVDIPYYYLEPQAVSTIMAFLFVGDMDMYRHYYVQARHDLQPWMPRKPSTPTLLPPGNFFSDLQSRETWQTEEKLRSLSQLEDFSIYTDYVPREMGSWKYRQDNQPEVIVGFGFRPDGEYFPSCRDRRYLMRGYAVCEDFYSPDYSRRPLPATEDHRRTLLWMPDVRFGPDGKATVRLYNNSHRTALSIEAVGITEDGQYIQYRTQP